jgi:hypothetical protein
MDVKPCNFQLGNGLKAKIYRLDHEYGESVSRLIRNTGLRIAIPEPYYMGYYVVEVKIADETVFLVYATGNAGIDQTDSIIQQLWMHLNEMVDGAWYVCCNNQLHKATSPKGKLLLQSVKTATPPSITCLLS